MWPIKGGTIFLSISAAATVYCLVDKVCQNIEVILVMIRAHFEKLIVFLACRMENLKKN